MGLPFIVIEVLSVVATSKTFSHPFAPVPFLKTYYHFRLINYIFLPGVIMLKSTKCFKNKSSFVVEVLFELVFCLTVFKKCNLLHGFNIFLYSNELSGEVFCLTPVVLQLQFKRDHSVRNELRIELHCTFNVRYNANCCHVFLPIFLHLKRLF